MKHVMVAGVAKDREFFLGQLQDLGLLHLKPCVPEPEHTETSTELKKQFDYMRNCLDMLVEFRHKPYGLPYTDKELPEVLCRLVREWKELHRELYALRHAVAVYTPWGDFEPADVARLEQLDVYIQLWSVPAKDYGVIEFPEGVYSKPINQHIDLLFCTVSYGSRVVLDKPVVEVPMPTDRVSELISHAHLIETRIDEMTDMFHQMASRRSVINDALNELQSQVAYAVAREGSYSDEAMFGLEGWVPATRVAEVREALQSVDRPVYVAFRDPTEEEHPPVLTKMPVWAKPARAFFDVLGVVPGYNEYDISPIFVVAIAVFTAMLIGDGGYGLVLFLPLVLFYRRLRYKLRIDPDLLHMIMILTAATAVYGLITMTIFGWTPADQRFVLLDGNNFELMMRICFLIGAVHLSVAHFWRACRKFTQPVRARGLADFGWIFAIWAMYFLILKLVLSDPLHALFRPLVALAVAFVILFTAPQKNVVKMIGVAILDIPLNALSCFSDVISYVRLMAVGAAGVIMERTFNELAIGLDNVVFTPLLLVLAHTLVLALGAVAIFVHGVRLNLLEYSGHMDILWSGRKYEPFCNYIRKETCT